MGPHPFKEVVHIILVMEIRSFGKVKSVLLFYAYAARATVSEISVIKRLFPLNSILWTARLLRKPRSCFV